jgi:peptide subunit release factor 1 (eRF1)
MSDEISQEELVEWLRERRSAVAKSIELNEDEYPETAQFARGKVDGLDEVLRKLGEPHPSDGRGTGEWYNE